MLLLVAVLMFVNYQDVIFFFFKEDNGVGAAVCTYA